MSKLPHLLMLLSGAALLFLLYYVLVRPPPQFRPPSMSQLRGEGFVWRRYDAGEVTQQLSATQVRVFLSPNTAQQARPFPDFSAKSTQLELRGQVTLTADKRVLRTARAVYADGVLRSDTAVAVVAPSMRLQGNAGFSYVLANGQLSLPGEIEGEFYSTARTRQ